MGLDPSGSPYEVLSTYLDSGDSLAELFKFFHPNKKLKKLKKRKKRKNSFENLIQKFALFAEKFLSGNGSLLFIFVDKNAMRASSTKVTGRVLLRTRNSNFLI